MLPKSSQETETSGAVLHSEGSTGAGEVVNGLTWSLGILGGSLTTRSLHEMLGVAFLAFTLFFHCFSIIFKMFLYTYAHAHVHTDTRRDWGCVDGRVSWTPGIHAHISTHIPRDS